MVNKEETIKNITSQLYRLMVVCTACDIDFESAQRSAHQHYIALEKENAKSAAYSESHPEQYAQAMDEFQRNAVLAAKSGEINDLSEHLRLAQECTEYLEKLIKKSTN